MSELAAQNNWRTRLGKFGAYGATSAFICIVIVFAVTQAAFRTWAVGRFFAGRAANLVDALLFLGVASAVTLITSCLGTGKERVVGMIVSLTSMASIVTIFIVNP
ncbi:MAG TPA: hypothetical protein VM865_07990 [Acidobacteriaceae bacterium]|jgi:hypothetical protein|nr:hypothetical protein [Acidobacteriaceae bacterium]